jgi:hypothetical protein
MNEIDNQISSLELSNEAIYSELLRNIIEIQARLIALQATVSQLTARLLPEETEAIKELAKEKYNSEKDAILSALVATHSQKS